MKTKDETSYKAVQTLKTTFVEVPETLAKGTLKECEHGHFNLIDLWNVRRMHKPALSMRRRLN